MAWNIYDVMDSVGGTSQYGAANFFNLVIHEAGLDGIVGIWDGSNPALQNFGLAIQSKRSHMNSFVEALVDKISRTIIQHVLLESQLKIFNKGTNELGRVVEEIFTDISTGTSYAPWNATVDEFRRVKPNTHVFYHDSPREMRFQCTIEDNQIEKAFMNRGAFVSFVDSVIRAMYNSDEVDQYVVAMATIQNAIMQGRVTYVSTPAVVDQVSAQEFAEIAREVSDNFSLPVGSRDYNPSGVWTRTPEERKYFLMPTGIKAKMDVNVLAYAFNMDRATIPDRHVLVQNFQIPGLQALLFDDQFLQFYDRLFTVETSRSASGLFYNVFLHHHQNISVSELVNVVAFMTPTTIPPIQQLTVRPQAIRMQMATTQTFYGNIQSINNTTTLVATLTDSNGNALPTGNTVSAVTYLSGDSSGGTYSVVVTLASNLTNNQNIFLVVTATNGTSPAIIRRSEISVTNTLTA